LDLSKTCDQYFENCECPDAQRLVDEGRINCSQAKCPADCAVCNFCLKDVVSCFDTDDMVQTTRLGGDTLPPSELIDQLSNVAEEEEAQVSFDLGRCETYQHSWLLDLENSCVSKKGSAIDCRCDDAQHRIDKGEIHCGESTSLCPDDCEVCKYCLESVLGCHDYFITA
jgi:hypothetical protein